MWEREDLIGTSIAPAPHSPGDPSLAAASPGSGGVTIIAPIPLPVDVTDRVGRLLGVLASITAPVDVSDRAGRLVGVVNDGGGSLTIDTAQLPAALVAGRLDENIGAWLGSVAPTVGQKAMAASLPIAIASDQSAVPHVLSGIADTSILPSAVRAATTSSADFVSSGYRGLHIHFNVIAVPGGDTVQLELNARISGIQVINYHAAFPAVSTTGRRSYIFYPDTGPIASYGATIAGVANVALPGIWIVRIVHSGVGNFTYQVDAVPSP